MPGFLDDLPKILDAISGVAGTVAQFTNRRDLQDEIPTLQGAVDAAEASRVYGQAAVDPTHPFFKNIMALLDEQRRTDVIAGISQMLKQEQRARARGLTVGGVKGERRDEARASAIAEAFERSGSQSRLDARSFLRGAAQDQAQAAASLGGFNNIFAQFGDVQAQERGNLLEGGQAALQSLGSVAQNIGGKTGGIPAPRLAQGFVSSKGFSQPSNTTLQTYR